LDNGSEADEDKYCKAGNRNSAGKCDSNSVYVAGVKLDMPFACTIGTTCVYKEDISGSSVSLSCQCAGDGTTAGYCAPYGTMTGWDDVILPKLQYSDGDCAGASVHTDSAHTLNYCNSISDDALTYILKMVEIGDNWSLYHSGAIDGCALDLGAFDPSYDINSYSGAEILVVSTLIALLY